MTREAQMTINDSEAKWYNWTYLHKWFASIL